MPFRKEMNGKHAVTIQNNSVDMRHFKKNNAVYNMRQCF